MTWDINAFTKDGYAEDSTLIFGKYQDEAKKLIEEYYNAIANLDISMLKYADIGFAVKNANEEAKKAADIVCDVTCTEGAIAWIINKLDKEGVNL